MGNDNKHYKGNPNLKAENVSIEFTEEQISEYLKCKKDPVYFTKNYVKIVSLDKGLVPFDLYGFQKKMIRNFHKHRFNILKLPRQSGKCCHKDTMITLRGKETGEILEISIDDFYKMIENNSKESIN